MKKMIALVPAVFLGACCANHGASMYVLDDEAPDGEVKSYDGTVLSVDSDGDLLMEVDGKLLFVDVEDIKDRAEMGDHVSVSGVVDNDADEGEATELNATSVVKHEME